MRPALASIAAGVLAAVAGLAACGREEATRSLVGDFAAPGTHALAGDTITVWRSRHRPDGTWLFESWSITPGATVAYRREVERLDPALALPAEALSASDPPDRTFALPPAEFEWVRYRAALLRPQALGPEDAVQGYAGEAVPAGCALAPEAPRLGGVNFLNAASWGAFVLQPGCTGAGADAAGATFADLLARLERAAHAAPVPAPATAPLTGPPTGPSTVPPAAPIAAAT